MSSTKQLKILAFGELLFDVIGGEEHLGGAPLNFSAHIAALGAQAGILSAVGCDDRGDYAIKRLQDYNVGCQYVIQNRHYPTGMVEVKLCPEGQPSYNIIEHVAFDNIHYNSLQIDSIAGQKWDAFYFGTLAQRNEVSRQSLYDILDKYARGVVFCDMNLRQHYYSRSIIEKSLEYADIVKINDEEQRILASLLYGVMIPSDQFFRRLASDYDVKLLVVTCGSRGCCVFDKNGWFQSNGIAVEVVDTVGAGDAFSAAFLYHYLSGRRLTDAARAANSRGAYIAGKRGAIPLADLASI